MKKNILGLVLGFIIGNVAVTYVQALTHLQADVDNAVCWDQTAPDLAYARALKVELKWDTAPIVVQSPICNNKAGSTISPFECGVQIPMTNQTVGTHALAYRVGNVEFDGSITYSALVNASYIIDPALIGPPSIPTNTSFLKKRLIALVELLARFFR